MASMQKACSALSNKDIQPFVPALISCLANPAEVAQCVHKLAATTFVQVGHIKLLPLLSQSTCVCRSALVKSRAAANTIITGVQPVQDPSLKSYRQHAQAADPLEAPFCCTAC